MLIALAATGLALPAVPAMAPNTGYRHTHQTSDNGVRYWRGKMAAIAASAPTELSGLIVGGAAGALVGRAIDTRGERATGTILGAAAGALLGREVQRSRSNVRCR